jgi:YesN/AraC family two-component response regulator
MTQKIRVMLADDEEHIRKLLAVVCSAIKCVEVVAEADDGEKALEAAHASRPDLVLLDINMPKRKGIDVLMSIKADNPDCSVIMLTAMSDTETVRQCIANGADNYLLKSNPPEKIRDIISEFSFKKLRQQSNRQPAADNSRETPHST